jgi:hypothetical protein
MGFVDVCEWTGSWQDSMGNGLDISKQFLLVNLFMVIQNKKQVAAFTVCLELCVSSNRGYSTTWLC